MEMDEEDGHGHVNGDAGGGDGREEPQDQSCAAQELREGRDVAEPGRQAKVRDEHGEAVEGARMDDFRPSMEEHDEPEDEAPAEGDQGANLLNSYDQRETPRSRMAAGLV